MHSLQSLPHSFKETIYKVIDQLKYKPNVVFSTDSYMKGSVKSQELMRRGGSQKILININTTMPADFACFLRNPENKTQLFNLMNKVLSNDESADRLHGKKFIMIVEGKSFQLTSNGSVVSSCELDNLHSTQEETDT